MAEKIHRFTDLSAWKEAYKLVLLVYKITNLFPQKEIYTLVSQVRRAAVSITSNIAEGFSRRTRKEKIQFYFMALGSLTEIQNQLIIAKGVGYIREKEILNLSNETEVVHKLINGLINGAAKIRNT